MIDLAQLGAILTGLTALFTAAAAVATFYAARATQQAAQGQLLLSLLNDQDSPDLLNDQDSPEMKDALEILVQWRKTYGEQFEEAFRRARDLEEWKLINAARRRVTSSYGKCLALHSQKLMSEEVLRVAVDNTGLTVFFQVASPLEFVVNPRAELGFATKLAMLCPGRSTGELIDLHR